jgi:hypothetical protein
MLKKSRRRRLLSIIKKSRRRLLSLIKKSRGRRRLSSIKKSRGRRHLSSIKKSRSKRIYDGVKIDPPPPKSFKTTVTPPVSMKSTRIESTPPVSMKPTTTETTADVPKSFKTSAISPLYMKSTSTEITPPLSMKSNLTETTPVVAPKSFKKTVTQPLSMKSTPTEITPPLSMKSNLTETTPVVAPKSFKTTVTQPLSMKSTPTESLFRSKYKGPSMTRLLSERRTILEEEEEKAKILETLIILDNNKSGIKNLGNICFCASVIQLLRGMGIFFKTDINILKLIKIQFPGYENSQEDASELLQKILDLMKLVMYDKYLEYTFGYETLLFFKLDNKYEKIINKRPNIEDYTMLIIDNQYLYIKGISNMSQLINLIINNENYEKNDELINMPNEDDLEDKSILDRIPNIDNKYQSYNKNEYIIPSNNKYIVIHLKLFNYNLKSNSTTKINKIIFPDNIIIKNKDNVRYEYEPKSIIYHTGRFGGGHYTNSTKYNSEWYYFDDNKKITYEDYNQMLKDAKNDKNQFSKAYRTQFTPYIILYKKK